MYSFITRGNVSLLKKDAKMGMDIASKLSAGAQVAGAVGSIAGGLMANTRRQQQYGDQVKLMGIQQGNQMALNRQMQEIQMENWEKTNYDAQRKQMEKAGLNTALMYGGSGGGGMIAQSGSGGSASGGNAPTPENGLGMMGIGLQQSAIAMQQLDNMKADAELKRAQTNEINTKLPEGVEGQKLQNEGLRWDNKNKDLTNQLAGRTLEDVVATAGANRNKALGEAQTALTNGNISNATYNEQVKKAKLDNALLIAQKQAIDTGNALKEQEIKHLSQEIEYFTKKFELDARRVGAQESYNKNLKEFQDSMIKQGYWKLGVEGVTNVAKMFMNPTSTISETISEGMKDKEGGYWNKTITTKK